MELREGRGVNVFRVIVVVMIGYEKEEAEMG